MKAWCWIKAIHTKALLVGFLKYAFYVFITTDTISATATELQQSYQKLSKQII